MSGYVYALGQLEKVGGRDVFATHKGQSGVAVFGPYTPLGPGRYLAGFSVAGEPYDTAHSNAICGSVDVVIDNARTVLARSNLFASRLNVGRTRVNLPFELDRDAAVELRVHTTGRTRLFVDVERTIRRLADDEPTFCPILAPDERPQNPFFIENLERFGLLHEAGEDITVTGCGPIVEARGVRFYVENVEDFQLVHEIFHVNEYTFHSARPKIAVDIGMNIGLVSLLMASDPSVIEVHSFEPFGIPFARAIENMALNPNLAGKITANRFGLAGEDAKLNVLADEHATIGASVRGATRGRPETIELRQTARALRPVLDKAAQVGADVFVKVDCEGSEFAIFEALACDGLFGSIRGFLVEWHKWWSPDLTQRDLFAPLLANDFVIFDRTDPVNPWAGQFYAVRAS